MTDTNNSGTVGVGVGGFAPAPTVLALYRHALDLCERLGITRPLSLHSWDWVTPPTTVYVFPDEWRPEWGKLRLGEDDTASGEAAVEGVMFRCACPLYQAVELGLLEGT